MFRKFALALAVPIGGLLAYAATRPDTFHLQRTATIKASAETVFPLINDFHNWTWWSPYEKLDPTLQRTYSGAPSGKGAVYEWDGNSKAGAGRMEIVRSSVPSSITIFLNFVRPFKNYSTTEFTLESVGDSTNVTWAMQGPNLFMTKVMGLFINMDNMIGKDFEAGLANLKDVAEKQAMNGAGIVPNPSP